MKSNLDVNSEGTATTSNNVFKLRLLRRPGR
jgi:hypothetical protein